MLPRQRLLAALNHLPIDRVPADLGSHPNASIHVLGYRALLERLGLQRQIRLMHRWMQAAEVDEDVLDMFQIDTRRLALGSRDRPLERDLDEESYADEWGVIRHKPPNALYYELKESPLSGEITLASLLRYPWPDPHDPGITRGLRQRARELRACTDCAVVLTLPSVCVHTTQFLRGFEDWFIDLASNPRLLAALFDAVAEVNVALAQDVLLEVGDLVDVVVVSDDLGGQRRLMVSPALYREWIKPRHRRYFDLIHRLSDAKLLFHSCGSVYEVLDDLVEIGVDALNPVQVSAGNMEPERLKARMGDRLAFWGAVDSQRLLPHGTPAEVQAEVRRCIATLGENGGYVLSAVHNIQPEVPPENVIALFQARREPA